MELEERVETLEEKMTALEGKIQAQQEQLERVLGRSLAEILAESNLAI